MKNQFDNYFNKAFCINLDHRTDRWQDCQEEFAKLQITPERIPGKQVYINGKLHGHAGCTAAHRSVLDRICENDWERILILEDDVKVIYEDILLRFEKMIEFVPNDWDMLYLGGHYSERPMRRINQYVIQCAGMFTTSSFAITKTFAERIRTSIEGTVEIDKLYSRWHTRSNAYIFQPRLMVQRKSYSDILEQECDNTWPMTDTLHESMV